VVQPKHAARSLKSTHYMCANRSYNTYMLYITYNTQNGFLVSKTAAK